MTQQPADELMSGREQPTGPDEAEAELPLPFGDREGPALRAELVAAVARVEAERDLEEQRVAEFWQTLYTLTPRVFITHLLIAANVIVYAIMIAGGVHPIEPTGESLVVWGSNFTPRSVGGEWWRLWTAAFLHGGFVHLAFNMLALWSCGRFVERLLGRLGFLLAYGLSAAGGSLAAVYWAEWTGMPRNSVGASGAVFGLYGVLAGFLLRHRGSIPMPVLHGLRNTTFSFIGYNIVFGLAIPRVDIAGHLGGTLAGLVCGILLSQAVSLGAGRTRVVRGLVLAAVGSLTVGAAIGFAPHGVSAFAAIVDTLPPIDEKCQKAFMEAQANHVAGKLTAEEFAFAIENDVLPAWQAMQSKLTAFGQLDGPVRQKLNEVRQYLDTRGESWRLLVDGLRSNDDTKLKRGVEKWEEANRLVSAMNQAKH